MRRIIILLTLGLVGISLLTGCGKSKEEKKIEKQIEQFEKNNR